MLYLKSFSDMSSSRLGLELLFSFSFHTCTAGGSLLRRVHSSNWFSAGFRWGLVQQAEAGCSLLTPLRRSRDLYLQHIDTGSYHQSILTYHQWLQRGIPAVFSHPLLQTWYKGARRRKNAETPFSSHSAICVTCLKLLLCVCDALFPIWTHLNSLFLLIRGQMHRPNMKLQGE